MAGRSGRGSRSRVGTVFVLIGLLTILGSTFGAGVYTGRRWGPPVPAKGEARKDERPTPPAAPTLTFYRELTAPLTAPPPPRPVKPPKPEDAVVIASRPAPAPPPPAVTPAPVGAFTVQVGAYKARPPADALRATLVAAGHDAEVVESSGQGEARYRVRVGAFATRDAARAAAARLSAERSLSTFVTGR